ncbi:hypothetical protein HPB51_022072 [Rhipicephalus microplus]|uniref:Uncharacterized protein n=1 Tax=Rhipicephalus microplus TaxID=6941 RepID=A0A9J6F6C4_RHIMP|nr:hypothetical protein HPB51_022072 [Rhipicephalus microplus]
MFSENRIRPIIVKFQSSKTKQLILSNGRKFKDTGFSVGEDFSPAVHELPPEKLKIREVDVIDIASDPVLPKSEDHLIEATYDWAVKVSAVLAICAVRRGSSPSNAIAHRVRSKRAIRKTDGAAGDPHWTPRADQ